MIRTKERDENQARRKVGQYNTKVTRYYKLAELF